MASKNFLTREGYEKLIAELQELKQEKLPQVLERLSEAKAMWDLSENFEYKSAMEDKDFINSRIVEIQNLLNDVEIIDKEKEAKSSDKVVDFGSTVTLKIEDDEKLTLLKKAVTKFMGEHTIYEAIPEDMKILVFNDKLLIKDSIEAMIKEDIYCGLLYNSKENKNSGIFTIRDVLGLLLIGYKKLILFLNTEKEITSYEMLKENSNKFFGTFDNVNEEKKNMRSGD